MADIQFSHGMGAYGREHEDPERDGFSLTMATNVAGALVSLALIAGIGVWGYELMVRDVSGIPVVLANKSEMRVRPDVPGGELARHQGLAVNAVAAEGQAAGPVDQVVLAPKDTDLADEDQPVRTGDVAPVTQPEPLAPASEVIKARKPNTATMAQDLQRGAIDDVVAELTAGIEPLETPSVEDGGTVLAQRQVIRPKMRPDNFASLERVSYVADKPTSEVDAAAIPTGTRLAQLGAFDSAEIARAEWARLESRFGDYLQDKSRVVQKAESGGRTFYRLRAMGFVDLGESRRFCSAFKAEGIDCISVAVK